MNLSFALIPVQVNEHNVQNVFINHE